MQIFRLLVILCCGILCCKLNAYADKCKATKITINNYEPRAFITNNNLLREPGEQEMYCGEKIIISGKVLDTNCMPVSDAKVYMWQVNCDGKYPYQPLKNRIDQNLITTDDRSSFTGNGIATSNNLGEFYFITTYPNKVHNLSPHVNLRVEHYKLGNVQTRVILRNHRMNSCQLSQLNSFIYNFASANSLKVYNYNIVLPSQ